MPETYLGRVVKGQVVEVSTDALPGEQFKAVLDAVMRYRMLREPGTEDLLRSILQGEQAQRRLASLRWGLLLIAVAIGHTFNYKRDFYIPAETVAATEDARTKLLAEQA